MKVNKNTPVILKAGFFTVFFLFLFFAVCLLMMLLSPTKDITDLVVPPKGTGNTQSSVSGSESTPAEDPSTPAQQKEYTYSFSTDLSAYEQYMNPVGDEYLTLINKDNRLESTYIPVDLIDVIHTRSDGRATQQMREYAAKALEALFIEAEAQGITYTNQNTGKALSVMSAYRSYEYQAQRFSEETARYGSEEEASKIVQYPGASEHQSGLCCDMHNLASADTSFEAERAAVWLAENCHKFGFILRYPKDKTEITGISYEPWHFRYVGRQHASKMKELGMCLEEYHDYLKTQN